MDSSDTVVFDRVDDQPPAPADATDRELTAALAAAAPRRWWDRTTLALGVLVLVLAGFLGGVHVQQRWGGAESGTAGAGRAGSPGGVPTAFPGVGGRGQSGVGPGGAGQPGGATAAATTTGTVKLVEGGTLYVETADGTVITVRTTDATAVRTAKASTLSALKAGQSVTVQGGPATDGTVTATTVTAGG
ncbi:hypothetical protein [Micromonospora humidisoli]|uniref:hypothetical protein n=1 Tax=Micromonospora sp. AKA109 TaxID=2733865 RepID=UPI002491B56A|nr:hypothetical protein [Micromonospora sp. AKA109]